MARAQSFMNFQRADKEGTISSSFHESSLTLIPKPNKGVKRKGNYRLCCLKHGCKNPKHHKINLEIHKNNISRPSGVYSSKVESEVGEQE